MDNITLLAIGIIVGVIGFLYLKGILRISRLKGIDISKNENSDKYSRTAGLGILIIGLSFVIAAILAKFSEKVMFYLVIIGVLVGLFFIAYARVRFTLNLYR